MVEDQIGPLRHRINQQATALHHEGMCSDRGCADYLELLQLQQTHSLGSQHDEQEHSSYGHSPLALSCRAHPSFATAFATTIKSEFSPVHGLVASGYSPTGSISSEAGELQAPQQLLLPAASCFGPQHIKAESCEGLGSFSHHLQNYAAPPPPPQGQARAGKKGTGGKGGGNRNDTSLRQLSNKFLKLVRSAPRGLLDLNVAAVQLKLKKRRIYDITNVLEGIHLMRKQGKNSVQWLGGGLPEDDQDDDSEADREADDAVQQEADQMLTGCISNMMDALLAMGQVQGNMPFWFVTDDDIKRVPEFQGDTLFLVKAAAGTSMNLPDYDIDGHHRMNFVNNQAVPIDVLLVQHQQGKTVTPRGADYPDAPGVALPMLQTPGGLDCASSQLERVRVAPMVFGDPLLSSGASHSAGAGPSELMGQAQLSTAGQDLVKMESQARTASACPPSGGGAAVGLCPAAPQPSPGGLQLSSVHAMAPAAALGWVEADQDMTWLTSNDPLAAWAETAAELTLECIFRGDHSSLLCEFPGEDFLL